MGYTEQDYNRIKNAAIQKKNTDARPLEQAIDEKVQSLHRYLFKRLSTDIKTSMSTMQKLDIETEKDLEAYVKTYLDRNFKLGYTDLFVTALVGKLTSKRGHTSQE